MITSAPNLNALWSRLLIEELLRNGVTFFCVSPGSRSAPLTVAAAENPGATVRIIYDERSAAFHALGYTRGSGRPAALICTSGSALAHYFPAVMEASLENLPLIILSADRPPELLDSGANQTVQQPGLFGKYLRYEFDLPCPDLQITPRMVLTTVDQAVHQARRRGGGPVHLNCMFREPLAPQPLEIPNDYCAGLKAWEKGNRPFTRYIEGDAAPSPQTCEEVSRRLNSVRRGILSVGRLSDEREQQAVSDFATALGWPVFADITSGLRHRRNIATLIRYFDQLLLGDWQFAHLNSGMLLHLGGRMVSKRWLQFLDEGEASELMVVSPNPSRFDPLHRVTTRLECSVTGFCRSILPLLTPAAEQPWVEEIRQADARVAALIREACGREFLVNEISAAYWISHELPEGDGLYLASSMPVRDMDMYAAEEGGGAVASNRGASGIDGSIAGAAGFAAGRNSSVTLMIGDLAFLHDIGSLALTAANPRPLIIILLNNQGGGIFSFLPIAQFTDVFEPYFGTPHSLTFENAADQFGLRYASPATNGELIEAYRQAREAAAGSGLSTLIELRSDRRENLQAHEALQKKIVQHLRKEG